ncbi:hypothetical protein Mmc1_1163 [Magnetococcus marinus MC-1]|uniref:Uncharacterized protein n=1 Tax=Magnetococcus marinus (strain ATCC BAA-1437 / JCM 17883 / MC-1) TaxID=156889 RepID=A0L6T1_MAGMM|nr:hypothetical protein [Magnetococcus marinus]ABK43674.1 hypothetical protein Mmc1_1163 [Magnetococcus marinus MC-1]
MPDTPNHPWFSLFNPWFSPLHEAMHDTLKAYWGERHVTTLCPCCEGDGMLNADLPLMDPMLNPVALYACDYCEGSGQMERVVDKVYQLGEAGQAMFETGLQMQRLWVKMVNQVTAQQIGTAHVMTEGALAVFQAGHGESDPLQILRHRARAVQQTSERLSEIATIHVQQSSVNRRRAMQTVKKQSQIAIDAITDMAATKPPHAPQER